MLVEYILSSQLGWTKGKFSCAGIRATAAAWKLPPLGLRAGSSTFGNRSIAKARRAAVALDTRDGLSQNLPIAQNAMGTPTIGKEASFGSDIDQVAIP